MTSLTSAAIQFGAPRLSQLLDELGLRGQRRDDAICAVADELRARGRDGLASQVVALRWWEVAS